MKTTPSSKLIELVAEIQRQLENTNSTYAENFVPGLITHPVPFFGKLEEAEVLTMGLNPSPFEFEIGRWPPYKITSELLASDLHKYFEHDHRSWNPWFDKWMAASSQLETNLQHKSGRVAHVDLSPRATEVASRVPQVETFTKMIRVDLVWLSALIDCAKSARILLMAGMVNEESYLIEFLEEHGREYQITVDRKDDGTSRSLGFYELHIGSRSLPVFFSGSGPSARDNGEKLKRNISIHRNAILELLAKPTIRPAGTIGN
ncbi:MAG TPA: hypothetical protein VIK53_00025 [Verrucomicrobiae bacterium]